MSELWRSLGLLALVVALIVAVLALFGAGPFEAQNANVISMKPIPPITTVEAQQLQQMPTFQYLVSYTQEGFQPVTLTVKEGDTVRFTNNSTGELWVAAISLSGDKLYPGTSACGGSSFDSCQALQSADFWQFTFNSPGTWNYQNNADPSQGGVITVK